VLFPSAPARILLARHGGTTSSDAGLFAGSSDVDLSDLGRAQANCLAERLAGEKIAAAYCSDMKRTIATATAVCARHGLSPSPTAALRELDHGHWEGLSREEVERRFAAEYRAWSDDPFTYAPPGGQAGAAVLARALPALTAIVAAHPSQTVLVVSHTATNRLLLCALLGIEPRRYRDRLAQDLACLNVLEFRDPANAKLLRMNDTSHLTSLPG
jgi:broad specificity phosphatase PhoE